jgi:hypothetical protein
MRHRPIGLLVVSVCFFIGYPICADVNNEAAPLGYSWRPLEHLTGKVLVPNGWFYREIGVQHGAGYQITKEEAGPKGSDYHTGFTIKGFSGAYWNKSRVIELPERIYEKRKKEGGVSTLWPDSIGPYTGRSFNSERTVTVGNSIETHFFIELVAFETETPSAFYVVFECPLSEWPQNKERCKMFFASLALFGSDNGPNQSSDPTFSSGAAAAGQEPRLP